MNIYLIIEDTLRGDFAEPLDEIFTLSFKKHTVGNNWTLPVIAEILTGYQKNGIEWKWQRDGIKDEQSMIEKLRGCLNKKTIAEYLGCYCSGSVGGNFVNGEYGFSRGFDYWQEYPFGFLDHQMPEKKDSFNLYHQYFIHDYFDDAGWNMHQMKLGRFQGVTREQISRAIECYKIRVQILKEKLVEFMGSHPDDIIILTADHGEAFLEHKDSIHHGNSSLMYEEICRVPLLIKIPKYKQQKIYQLSRSIDILPTILGLYNKKANLLPGVDLLKMVGGKKFDLEIKSVFSYHGEEYNFYAKGDELSVTKKI